MKKEILTITSFLFLISLLGYGGIGNSIADGEIVPIEQVCAYEKAKTVAVEGFLAPNTMRCERASNKKSGGITECGFTVYAESGLTGAGLTISIPTGSWLGGKNNRIEDPASYTGDLQFYDRGGNPLPKKGLRIYDNDGNLIPENSKIRVYGKLPNSGACEFGSAERIERVEGEQKWQITERSYRNFPMESF